MNCCVAPAAMLRLEGVTETETSAVDVPVSEVEPEIDPTDAVIVVVPAPAAVASPFEPSALLIVAIPVLDDVHAAVAVIFCVAPFE